jgi:BirA family biotin operon repressor/biotin-[acetyl-CoA-carboxylase] ligase
MDIDRIKANLATGRVGRNIMVLESTASTNDVAARHTGESKHDGLAVFAEEQTAGRGRAGTKWHGGRRQSVLCSILLVGEETDGELLSLAAAVATAECIGRQGRNHAMIRWPNDVMVGGRKIAGILLESRMPRGPAKGASARGDSGPSYIIGVGINCHQKPESFPAELRGSATSIDIESKTVCDRESIAKSLLSSLDQWLRAAAESPETLVSRWRRKSMLLGQRVKLVHRGRGFAGNCIGADPQRGLILQLERGGVRMFDAAHTRIVP